MGVSKKKNSLYLLSLVAIVILDQITKRYVYSNFHLGEVYPVIRGFFNITYITNTGAAWGIGAGSGELVRVILFLILPVLFCGWLAWLFYKSLFEGPLHLSIAYMLIIAGAIGNLLDRFILGFVIDFLQFYWRGYYFPSFNVADSVITIAGFILVYDILFLAKRREIIES